MRPAPEAGAGAGAGEGGAPGEGPASGARPDARRIRLPIPFSLGRVNVYLLPGAPLTLVDTGPNTEEAYFAIRDGLAQAGYGIASLERILLTHAHVDHAGLAARLQAESGARVLAHPRAIAALEDWPATWARRAELVGKAARAAGAPEALRSAFLDEARGQSRLGRSLPRDAAEPLADGVRLRLGGRRDDAPRWRVAFTPGHSPDHVCALHEPSGALVAGDLMLRGVPTVPLLEPSRADGARPRTLSDLLDSWRRIGRMPVRIAWSGHGPPVRAHRVLLARRLASTRDALRATRRAVQDGAETLWEIAQATGLDERASMLDVTLGYAVARTDWLVDKGYLARRVEDGLLRFARAR